LITPPPPPPPPQKKKKKRAPQRLQQADLLQTSELNLGVDPLSSQHLQASWLVAHLWPEQQHKLVFHCQQFVFLRATVPVQAKNFIRCSLHLQQLFLFHIVRYKPQLSTYKN